MKTFEEFINEATSNIENYMFIGNQQSIKENVEFLLSLDPIQMDEKIKNGHDWAEDHISVANENLDQVAHFFKNLSKSS